MRSFPSPFFAPVSPLNILKGCEMLEVLWKEARQSSFDWSYLTQGLLCGTKICQDNNIVRYPRFARNTLVIHIWCQRRYEGKKPSAFYFDICHLDRTLWVRDHKKAQFNFLQISSNNFFDFLFEVNLWLSSIKNLFFLFPHLYKYMIFISKKRLSSQKFFLRYKIMLEIYAKKVFCF